MNNIFLKIKQCFSKFLAFFPSKLPVGDAQWGNWVNSIVSTYDLPNNDSIHFALATMIMGIEAAWKDRRGKWHYGYRMPKRYFGMTLLKGAAQQQAYNVMGDCKARQEAARKAAEAAADAPEPVLVPSPSSQPAEATAPSVEANVPAAQT